MDLFSPYKLGNIKLSNRMVMAPMTRCRAIGGNVPNPLAITYYVQRATAGLIITEGSQVSPEGVGYVRTPGIYSPEQVAGWRKVTNAVHQSGSKIFLQLWHVGRVSHSDFLSGELPVAPSPLPVEGDIHTPFGKKKIEKPRALELEEIPGIINQFRRGALNAKAAGFDGVEIHGANGYLLDQFLRDGPNHRTDQFGGSLKNRARLPLEVAKAVIDVFGADRIGYRISPHFQRYSMSDSNPHETFCYFAEELNKLKLGYLHMIEPVGGPMLVAPDARLASAVRDIFKGTLILNGGYDAEKGNAAIQKSVADLISYGSPFLANPDLPERFKRNAPLNTPDITTFYAGEERGYIDYPAL
ncbi:MAG: alkene reductase [Methanothrix sp.]|nr:alkene reductase [Methanothrix sp.]